MQLTKNSASDFLFFADKSHRHALKLHVKLRSTPRRLNHYMQLQGLVIHGTCALILFVEPSQSPKTTFYTQVVWSHLQLQHTTEIGLSVWVLLLAGFFFWNPIGFPGLGAARSTREARAKAKAEAKAKTKALAEVKAKTKAAWKADPELKVKAKEEAKTAAKARSEAKADPKFRAAIKANIKAKAKVLLHRIGRSLAVSVWMTIVGFSGLTWIYSVHREYPDNPTRTFLFFFGALLILFATFVLEGLEAAYSELRDKDDRQFQGRAGGLFEQIKKMGRAFFETKEWSIVALVVLTTLMVDRDPGYFIPGICYANSNDSTGRIVRIALSMILSTLPFVWLAQSPGKYVARKNSAQFLKYTFAQVAVFLLRRVNSFFMKPLGLQYPSEVTDELALMTLSKSNEERVLPPSEYSFFADGLKKYGYGVPLIEDTITIDEHGACEMVSRHLAYVVMPRSIITRNLHFEIGFEEGTIASLECKDAPGGDTSHACTKWWVFDAPMIGEKVSDPLLLTWMELFYHPDPGKWECTGYRKRDADLFHIKATEKPFTKAEQRQEQTMPDRNGKAERELKVELNFRQNLPAEVLGKIENALLVLWEIRVKTLPDTVDLPNRWGDRTKYPYSKTHSHPCLRSTISFILKSPETIFVESGEEDHFSVKYGDTVHQKESATFRRQDRFRRRDGSDVRAPEPKKNLESMTGFSSNATQNSEEAVRTVEIPVATTEPGPKFIYYLDSPLPEAYYKVHLWIEKAQPSTCEDHAPVDEVAVLRGKTTKPV